MTDPEAAAEGGGPNPRLVLPVPPGGERQDPRKWTIRVCEKHGPLRQTYCEGCGTLDYGQEVRVVEASSVPVGDEPDPGFGGLTRDEVRATLSASEGMAVLPQEAEVLEIAERTGLDPDRVRDVLDARDDQNDDAQTLRGAAIEALDALEGYLQGEAGLPFVEAYGAARKAAEYLRVGLAAAETRERSASASTNPSSGAAPKGETDFRVEQTYEEIERAIREEVSYRLLEGPPEEAHLQPSKSEVEWADKIANEVASGVMRQMDEGSPPPDRLTDLEHEATRAAFHLREATGLIDTDDVAAWKHVQMAYDRLRLAGRELED